MAELNEIRFLLLISLMIFSARALDVILSAAHQNFKQKSEINIDIVDGEKAYHGTFNRLTYEAERGTSKVIVYIISRSRCIEILRPIGVARETVWKIARELREMHYELVFLGIEHFDDDEYHVISAFMHDTIVPHPDQKDFVIETIGENRFDHFYHHSIVSYVKNFQKYQENAQFLLARLRSIPRGALRPVGSNNKEIKLYGYQPVAGEVKWSVNVLGGKYFPNVDLSDSKYNFRVKYPKKKICLLIISGKEYSVVTSYKKRSSHRAVMQEPLVGMKNNDEALIIMGVFNFDWTEVDIVTQIILRHSEGLESSVYNVFTCGYGMFDTYYLNAYEDDRRYIWQIPNSNVSRAIELLMGDEVKKRAIIVYYFDDRWKSWNMTINLGNGRYFPEFKFINRTLPCQHQKIAFIVYDRAEVNVPVDYSVVGQSLQGLERSGISLVLVEAVNFRLDDIHIIAEWIDCHSGVIDLEQIAVLGAGIFDTIFQSRSNTYNTFLNTNKNELKHIRNAYVMSGNRKSVFATNIDEFSEFEVWPYPINTVVNGFYEPDVIPDKNMFDTTDGRKIYFIITSAYHFQQILAIKSFCLVISLFRRNINPNYPYSKWSINLVGLDNFEERDAHLFAELVKMQTNDGRPLGKFVHVTNYDINQSIYQYKDTAPFHFDTPNSTVHTRFTSFLEMQTFT